MQWSKPKTGDVRINSGFLFLPKTITYTTKWLVSAKWKQQYYISPDLIFFNQAWIDKEWID